MSEFVICVDDYYNFRFYNSYSKCFVFSNFIYLYVRRGIWFNKFELVLKWELYKDDNSGKCGKMEELFLKFFFFT